MAPPLLQLKDIALTFGGTPLLSGVELSVSTGERVALVGRNGSGKSTLLKIAAGHVKPDRGSVFMQPGAVVRYLPQEPDFSGFASTLAYVEFRPRAERRHPSCRPTPGSTRPHRAGGSGASFRRRGAPHLLAHVLAPSPDILLLDEPTNHLDLAAIEWLEQDLNSRRTALVLISHDRRFLSSLSRSTVWLDRGYTRRVDRGFAHFEEWRDMLLAEEEREQHKLDRKIVAEEHWMRYGVTGRRKRNMLRVGKLQALREQRRTYRASAGNATITAGSAMPSGALVIEAVGIGKSYGDVAIVRDFSIRIQRGDRIGIVGPNGSGKTTLINLLTGTLPPDAGSVRLGSNLAIATLDQHRDSLDPDVTVAEALTGGGDTVMVNGQAKHVVSYMKDFLFTSEQARTPLGKLSGGERGRLMLAQVLAKPSNLLILDEPTNDLDMETLDVLEDVLGEYSGTVLIVSHDRDFLDRLVSGVIVPEGHGLWTEYAGGYSDMLAQRGASPSRDRPKQEPAKAAQKLVSNIADPAATKRRMSFKDKHALDTLPKTIARLQSEADALKARLDDPRFYARDRGAFETTTAALAKLQQDIAAAEEQWLALEILREELAGAP